MSSALSSSSDLTMRARRSDSFFFAGVGVSVLAFFARGFLAAGVFLEDFAFAGAFFAPVVLRVRMRFLQSNAAKARRVFRTMSQ
ncbi:MAG TPA: hypothetical protein VG867_07265, partial [Rhizomicrobium sp.]|nr:hypothetical protein [Rhizomicrobium sp.]